MNPQIVVIGSLNTDFVIRVTRFPVPGETLVAEGYQIFPGGKGANQAYAAAKLGARVAMVGQVGNDAQADWLKANLAAVGVEVGSVLLDPTVPSGSATITINREGQNQIIIVPGANGTFSAERLDSSRDVLARAGVVLLQLEVPLPTVMAAARLARNAGALVILDPAPAQPLPDELLALADYLTPNETELCLLNSKAPTDLSPPDAALLAGNLLARGARKVLVKMGAQGALLVGGKQNHFWPALPVKAVDSTAAGDAFNAAFAAGFVQGRSEEEAGDFATAAAACSVQRAGAQPSMPAAAEVEGLRQLSGRRKQRRSTERRALTI
jgi:ribokinase